jgi:acetoin utilization protein AcuB
MVHWKRLVRGPEPQWPDPVPVKEWMTQPVTTVGADAPVRQAAELMKTRQIRHLPVVENNGRLIGIVTDRDLRQMIFDPRIQERLGDVVEALAGLTVREIMTWAVIVIRPGSGIRQAARLMREQKVGALPVVEAGRVVGILTERDLLRAFEELIRDRVKGVHPLAEAPALGKLYEYGFPEPSGGEPWRNEARGLLPSVVDRSRRLSSNASC